MSTPKPYRFIRSQDMKLGEYALCMQTQKVVIKTEDGFVDAATIEKAAIVGETDLLKRQVERLKGDCARLTAAVVALTDSGKSLEKELISCGAEKSDSNALSDWDLAKTAHQVEITSAMREEAEAKSLLSAVVSKADKLAEAIEHEFGEECAPSAYAEWEQFKKGNNL